MNLRIQAIKFDASEKLQLFITKKLEKLQQFCDEIDNVDVYLKVVKPESTENKEVEISISALNTKLFASKVCDTFEEAVDLAVEALEKQLKKTKDKQ